MQLLKELEITWVTGDALEYQPNKPVDIVVSSLMAHHLEDEEVVALLQLMKATAQLVGSSMIWSALSGAAACLGGWRGLPVSVKHRRPGRLCVGRWKEVR
jgi:hypothetical protein